MPLHTKKQFADLCGIKTGDLSNYQKRGKVVYSGEYVDDNIEPNISFFKKAQDKKNGQQVPETPKEETLPATKELTTINYSEPKYKAPKTPNVKPPKEKEATGYSLANEKVALQIENLELKNREMEEKINTKLGNTIPKEPVVLSFQYINKNMCRNIKVGIENLITRYEKNFTPAQFADIRAAIVKEINHAQTNAVAESKKNIAEIILISSSKKEVGERE